MQYRSGVRRFFKILFCSIALSPILSWAEFEAGIGMSATYVPHYVGSDQATRYYLPFPYLRYQSETLKIDRNFVQSKLWQSGKWVAEMSFGGAVPVRSNQNDARKGMEDLDFILEAGPALHYYILGNRMQDNSLSVELPLRSAISTDFSKFEGQGFTFTPRLLWRRGYHINQYYIRPQIALGFRSATAQYHDYIYGVDKQFETIEREAYKGKAGYGGWQFNYSTIIRWEDKLLAGFLRYIQTDGAAFKDSPLIRQNDSLLAGIAFAHIF